MRILYANDFLVYAGAEKVARQLTALAKSHGHESRLVAPYLNRDHEQSGEDVTVAIQNWKPDLVHFHNVTSLGFQPLEYCVKHEIPAVWTVHDWYPVCKYRTRINDEAKTCDPQHWTQCSQCIQQVSPVLENLVKLREVAQNFETVTLCNAQRLLMGDFGYDLDHITVVKNGVDINSFKHAEDNGYIFCFGVMRYEKALDWHLQSAELLPYPHAMAGEQIAYKLDTQRVKSKVLGFLSEQALVMWLGHSSLVQVPSRWHEPCGLTILESFACGKPVVAVAMGGVPEYVVDGETGFLADEGDIVGFIDLTYYLMENQDLRAEMSKNCLEASRYYSLDRVWSDYERVYRKAYGGKLDG